MILGREACLYTQTLAGLCEFGSEGQLFRVYGARIAANRIHNNKEIGDYTYEI